MDIELTLLVGAGSGLVSGALAGLLGIGGGLVVMPLLYACLPLLGVDAAALPRAAVATALAAMLPTCLSATWAQQRRRAIDWPWVMAVAPATLLGTALGALAATQLHGRLLSLLFVAYALWCGLRMLLPLQRFALALPAAPPAAAARPGTVTSGALALLVGALGAGAGLGGGLVIVPHLLARGFQMKHAVANSTVLNLLVSGGGVLALQLLAAGSDAGPTQWLLAAGIGIGAAAGAPGGVALSHRLPVGWLRCGFGVVTLLAGVAMLLRL